MAVIGVVHKAAAVLLELDFGQMHGSMDSWTVQDTWHNYFWKEYPLT